MKVKAVEILGKKSYLIKAGELSRHIDFYLNRVPIHEELKTKGLTIKKTDVLEFMPSNNTLIGYERGKQFLTIEEYQSKPQSYYDDSSEEIVLRAIANRKELQGFEPKYKERDFELVELDIYGNIKETNSNFIFCGVTSIYNKEPIVYTLNVNDVTIDEYRELEKEYSSHANFEKLDRRYLRYAKINNSYAFSDCYPFTEIGNEKIFASLEEATKEELIIRELVRKYALPKIFPKNLHDEKKHQIIAYLKSVKKAKSKSCMDEMLQILINELKEYKNNIEI